MSIDKKVIRRNLPINDIYKIVDSYYLGSLADGNGCACDNCNKIITNVAVIENKQGVKYNVGLDCAETLSGLDYFEFNQTKADFNEAKAIRAKVNKANKEGRIVEFKINFYGNLNIYCNGKFSENKDIPFVNRFFKDYLNEVFNKDKIGFTYSEYDFNQYHNFKGIAKKEYLNETKIINYKDYIIHISLIQKGNNVHFLVELKKDSELISDYSFYMANDISRAINSLISKYEFGNYKN